MKRWPQPVPDPSGGCRHPVGLAAAPSIEDRDHSTRGGLCRSCPGVAGRSAGGPELNRSRFRVWDGDRDELGTAGPARERLHAEYGLRQTALRIEAPARPRCTVAVITALLMMVYVWHYALAAAVVAVAVLAFQ